MKAKIIKDESEKIFNPFKIELTVESIEEARLLYHVANSSYLLGSLRDAGYNLEPYNKNISQTIGDKIWDIIGKEIIDQGFEI